MLIIVKDCVVSVTICTLNQQFPFSTNPWVGYLAALAWPWLPQLFIRLIPLRFWGVPVDETKMVTYSFACRSTGSYWERFERLNAFNSPVPHLTWNVRSPSSRIRPLGRLFFFMMHLSWCACFGWGSDSRQLLGSFSDFCLLMCLRYQWTDNASR